LADYLKLLLLFGLGSIAGFINVNAGGGSALTLPILIFFGMEGVIANGTNRIAIFIQNLSAIASFHNLDVHQFKLSARLAIFTLPGAIIGALVATKINDEWFQRILGIIMFGIVLSIIISPNRKAEYNESKKEKRWLIYPLLFGIGFYGGFIQTGVGFLIIMALYHTLKIGMVRVNMHKVFIICIYTLPALIIFIWTGNVNWSYGLCLAAGMAFGAWWGAHVAVKKGEKAIRTILAFSIFVMSIKLLNLF